MSNTIELLQEPLQLDEVARRAGYGAQGDLVYLEGHYVIEQLNRIFAYDWDQDFHILTSKEEKPTVIAAQVTLTARFGETDVTKSDVGIGIITGAKAENLEMAYKTAVTDGLKRCARLFGSQFGLDLYDKEFAAKVSARLKQGQVMATARPVAPTATPLASAGACTQCGQPVTGYTTASGAQVSAHDHAKRSLAATFTGHKLLCAEHYHGARKGSS